MTHHPYPSETTVTLHTFGCSRDMTLTVRSEGGGDINRLRNVRDTTFSPLLFPY